MSVCCLPNENFQAGSVGRQKYYFAPCPRKRYYFKANQFINKRFFFSQKMVDWLVNSKPKLSFLTAKHIAVMSCLPVMEKEKFVCLKVLPPKQHY